LASVSGTEEKACIADKSLKIFERCRLEIRLSSALYGSIA
jgi:hypothetical protein